MRSYSKMSAQRQTFVSLLNKTNVLMDLDAIEVRVLGCLIEKQRTTPDAYPLSLNALRLACNQRRTATRS